MLFVIFDLLLIVCFYSLTKGNGLPGRGLQAAQLP